ncbi:MAG TPA: carboxypeptidase-like regulatory domain-containing protein, partial [Polyangiaceae bacterium]|nr:carboxypeptidase-like regulatory domain-containing protein [Polyangiaceae bacterium]
MNVEQRRRVRWRVPWLAALVAGAPAAALGLLSPAPAWAQTIGVATLSGKIIDANSKAPAADAVVTVTSPALQGEQTVVTDGSGFYRLPNLPPGDYTVRVEADKHHP